MDITFTKNDYYKRIKNYKSSIKKLKNLKENQCLTFGSKNKFDSYYQYYLNKSKIVLKKNIGSRSRYGLIFLTYILKTKNQIFATKVMEVNKHNTIEIDLSKKMSEITLKDLSPHFLLIYKTFICNNIEKDKKLPSLIRKNDYYISINELADGNLKNFLMTNNNPELIENCYQQILLAVLSFHYHTGGVYHKDCHYKNFLFHRIKEGGYFHYKIFGKDVYVENKGYIWMIWDFGLAKIKDYEKENRLEDYFTVNEFFKTSKSYDNYDMFMNIYKYVSQLSNLQHDYKNYIGYSDVLLFKEVIFKFKNLFKNSYDKNSFIINKKPYTIKNF